MIEVLSAAQARDFTDFMLPSVTDSPDFDEYAFYAYVEDDVFQGILVADPTEYEPEILSIGVSEKYQRNGVATKLLRFAVLKLTEDFDAEYDAPNHIVARFPSDPETSEIVKNIFIDCRFNLAEEGAFFETTIKGIADSEILHENSVKKVLDEKKLEITSLAAVDKQLVKAFGTELAQTGVFPAVNPEDYDEDVSFFLLDNDRIIGCILFDKQEDDFICNSLVYLSPEHGARQDLIYILAASARALEKKFPSDFKVIFLAINDVSDKLIAKILPDAKKNESALYFELPFETAKEMTIEERDGNMSTEIVSEENMVCSKCKFCQNMVLECQKYYQKPDAVLDGGKCEEFEEL